MLLGLDFQEDNMLLVLVQTRFENANKKKILNLSVKSHKYINLRYIYVMTGNPVYRILFPLGRNDEIRKEYLSTGY